MYLYYTYTLQCRRDAYTGVIIISTAGGATRLYIYYNIILYLCLESVLILACQQCAVTHYCKAYCMGIIL